MGKRQKRINSTEGYTAFVPYVGQYVSIVCASGIVYYGILITVESEFVRMKDLSGNTIKLVTGDLKEIIIDYVSQ